MSANQLKRRILSPSNYKPGSGWRWVGAAPPAWVPSWGVHQKSHHDSWSLDRDSWPAVRVACIEVLWRRMGGVSAHFAFECCERKGQPTGWRVGWLLVSWVVAQGW